MRGDLCILGFIVLWGGSFVSWVFDGGFLLNLGFIVLWEITLYLGCWMGGSIGYYFIMGVTLYLGFLLEGFFVSWVSCGF
jgi:hypothetical protein